MTPEEKLSKAVKLADAMYYAAQMLSTDAFHLKEAMKDWWHFKNVDDAYIEGMAFAKNELEKQGEQPKEATYTHEVETGNGNIKALVTKKVQLPKFHEGEWLCENEPNNYARFIQILEIVNVQGKESYRISRDIHNDEDVVEFNFVEEYYHKFDIKDAKDGDMLAINWQEGDDSWEKIIIFKKYHNKGVKGLYSMLCIEGYGNTFKNGELAINEEVPYYSKTWTCNLHPATKEQRDTLMKAMDDAGYTFDFEKKELKKIEQKPAWSEEDESLRLRTIGALETCKIGSPTKCVDEQINWLKSLKQRIGG